MSCTELSTIFIYVLPFVLVAIFMATFGRKLPYPPGPKGYPLIGNMAISNTLTHRGLAQLSERYGGLCHLKMGMLHMVVVSTPEMAKEVLQAQDYAFSNRPATLAINYLTYDRADMAFAHYGPFWRQMRKICVMKLFSRKRVESWASVREEVDALVHTIETKDGTPINISALVFGMAKNITCRAAFGSTSYEGQDEFVKIMQEFSKLFGAFHIADFFPNMGLIFGQKFYRRLEKARNSLDRFIDKIIDDHIAKRKNKKDVLKKEVDNDMVDELMEFYNEDGGAANFIDESQYSFKISRDNIKALIMDVMFGGTETVASAIEWAMAELMHSPEDLKKVQQELLHVVGSNRQVQESDLEKLTYLHCVVKETLRLHPPIPLLLHETSKDCVVAGYKVPAKARVMINVWAINRDKTAWDDAHTFKPSRFLTNDAPDFKGSDFEFIPFGSGRRSCPGMQLGLYSLNLMVAKLCHGFSWELPDGMKPSELDMNDVFGLTAPRAIQLVAVPRNRLTVGLVGM